jgi:hypothetical protein
MRNRLLILLGVYVLGFGATFALPQKMKSIRLTAMPGSKARRAEFGDMTLPTLIANFVGGPTLAAGEQERTVLAADTGFSKRQYSRRNYTYRPRENADGTREDGDYEIVTASVVTAGSDMGNSIHRPERCLTAQGHNLAPSKAMSFPCRDKHLPVTKIQAVKADKYKGPDGKEVLIDRHSVMYYWFVGNQSVTGSHFTRTIKDLTDRLTTGTDQEWAYASVTIPLDAQLLQLDSKEKDGPRDQVFLRNIDDKVLDEHGLTDADRVAQEFISEFARELIDEKMVKDWGN